MLFTIALGPGTGASTVIVGIGIGKGVLSRPTGACGDTIGWGARGKVSAGGRIIRSMSNEPEEPQDEAETAPLADSPTASDDSTDRAKVRDQPIGATLAGTKIAGLVTGKITGGLTPKDLGLGVPEGFAKGLSESIFKSSGIESAISKLIGASTPPTSLVNVPEPFRTEHDYGDVVSLAIDPAPRRTADAAEQTAEYTRDLLNAMRDSLQLNESVRQENAEAASFTRRVSILTIVIASASFALGVASLVVAVVALNHP